MHGFDVLSLSSLIQYIPVPLNWIDDRTSFDKLNIIEDDITIIRKKTLR